MGAMPTWLQPAGRFPPVWFRPVRRPLVSVVVCAFNHVDLTARSLTALFANTDLEAIEVIVVDDCSTDETAAYLERVPNVRVIRHWENKGFLRSANHGAAAARGEHIFFLNNDAEVTPGWLGPLLDELGDPSVGAAGSMLVYPDGRIQEAGVTIWSDGTGWALGRDAEMGNPEYLHRRTVDYCSGAALMVRAAAFARVGGFDERFVPAYYEDVDLCFSLRRLGLSVVYVPDSQVVHHEGMSHGTEERPDAGLGAGPGKVGQFANRRVFAAKWATELSQRLPPAAPEGIVPRSLPRRPWVFVADCWIPAPDHDAGSLRMHWILRLLKSLGLDVTLWAAGWEVRDEYASDLRRLGIEVHRATDLHQLLAPRAGMYDVAFISRPDVGAATMDYVRRYLYRAPVVYDTVDIHHVRVARAAAVSDHVTEDAVEYWRGLELDLFARADLVATVTEDDARVVERAIDGVRTVLLPTVHPPRTTPVPPFGGRSGIAFIGGYAHPPNVDAVEWLVREILPQVRSRVAAPVWLLGSSPTPAVHALADHPEVRVPGWLPDVDPLFDQARVFVAPIRYGSGMKGKIGHAMAAGLPVVTTSIGAEGMDLDDEVNALIRDDVKGFAEAVVRLHQDGGLWRRLSSAGRRHAEGWSPAATAIRLQAMLADLGVRTPDVPPPRRVGGPTVERTVA
jgi:GT2 family glycosyltransferase/glycosyltransferase involved in cell wall biosynthesis